MHCTQLFWVPLNGGLCCYDQFSGNRVHIRLTYHDQTSGNRVHIRLTYLDRIPVRRVEFHFKTQPDSVRAYWTCVTRNSQGVEACNSHMFALYDAREYSFLQVPYLEREEKITDQSNLLNNVKLFNSSLKNEFALLTSDTFQPLMSFWCD